VGLWLEWQTQRALSGLKSVRGMTALEALAVLVRRDEQVAALFRDGWPDRPAMVVNRDQLPAALRAAVHPPFGLDTDGDIGLISGSAPRIGVIGSRHPTESSIQVTAAIVSALATRGVTIVSGMAIGIDGIAHRAALDAGGSTIAVLGSGLDRPYPARHRRLAQRIRESGGLVMSEYHRDVVARPHHFHQRNRLIAGLSNVLLVVQARQKSGSMVTVNAAADMGVDVCVVPSSIGDLNYDGSLSLIRDGATVVVDAGGVLRMVGLEPSPQTDHALASILERPRSADEVASLAGLTPADTWVELLDLELAGLIARTPEGRYVNAVAR
jgi:DNA processing protein